MDYRNCKVLETLAVQEHLGYAQRPHVHILYFLGGHVLSLLQLENILFAVDNF